MSLWWTGALQSIPEVISAAWKIRPTSEVKKTHFTFLSLFLCSDVDLEAGFVIYVKNRSRGSLVGHSGSKSTSLRPDLHISAPQSRWTRHERPAPRPCATTRALAGGAAVCEQGPPNPVGSRGRIGRRSRFCRLFGHRQAASCHK